MRFEGACIIVENRPVPLAVRIFSFVVCLPLFCVGLLALHNIIVQLLIEQDYQFTTGGFIIGTLITGSFLIIPAIIVIYVVLKPYKTLRLDPQTRQGYLTRRYPFATRERSFEFCSITPPSISFREEGMDSSAGWLLALKLPDKTILTYEAMAFSLAAQKAAVEEWSEHISTMLKGG